MHAGALAALLVALVVAASGCRTGVEAGPEEEARAAMETFLYTCAIGRVTGAELVLTEQVRTRFITAGQGLAGCLRVMDIDLEGDPPSEDVMALFADAEATAATADGGFAHVDVEAREFRRRVELELVRGRWFIGEVTGP